MHAVRSLLLLLVLVAVTLTLLLAGATGVGVLLHRLMPTVGLGTAVLIGLVGLSVSARFVLGLWDEAHSLREELGELQEAQLQELVTAAHGPARRRRSRR